MIVFIHIIPIKKNIHVQGYVNMLEDFLLETIFFSCGTISNGAQCIYMFRYKY